VYVSVAIICMKIERSQPFYHTVMLLLCVLSAASWMVGKTPAPHMATEKTMVTPYSEVGHINCKNGLCARKRNLCYPVCEAKLSDTYAT